MAGPEKGNNEINKNEQLGQHIEDQQQNNELQQFSDKFNLSNEQLTTIYNNSAISVEQTKNILLQFVQKGGKAYDWYQKMNFGPKDNPDKVASNQFKLFNYLFSNMEKVSSNTLGEMKDLMERKLKKYNNKPSLRDFSDKQITIYANFDSIIGQNTELQTQWNEMKNLPENKGQNEKDMKKQFVLDNSSNISESEISNATVNNDKEEENLKESTNLALNKVIVQKIQALKQKNAELATDTEIQSDFAEYQQKVQQGEGVNQDAQLESKLQEFNQKQGLEGANAMSVQDFLFSEFLATNDQYADKVDDDYRENFESLRAMLDIQPTMVERKVQIQENLDTTSNPTTMADVTVEDIQGSQEITQTVPPTFPNAEQAKQAFGEDPSIFYKFAGSPHTTAREMFDAKLEQAYDNQPDGGQKINQVHSMVDLIDILQNNDTLAINHWISDHLPIDKQATEGPKYQALLSPSNQAMKEQYLGQLHNAVAEKVQEAVLIPETNDQVATLSTKTYLDTIRQSFDNLGEEYTILGSPSRTNGQLTFDLNIKNPDGTMTTDADGNPQVSTRITINEDGDVQILDPFGHEANHVIGYQVKKVLENTPSRKDLSNPQWVQKNIKFDKITTQSSEYDNPLQAYNRNLESSYQKAVERYQGDSIDTMQTSLKFHLSKMKTHENAIDMAKTRRGMGPYEEQDGPYTNIDKTFSATAHLKGQVTDMDYNHPQYGKFVEYCTLIKRSTDQYSSQEMEQFTTLMTRLQNVAKRLSQPTYQQAIENSQEPLVSEFFTREARFQKDGLSNFLSMMCYDTGKFTQTINLHLLQTGVTALEHYRTDTDKTLDQLGGKALFQSPAFRNNYLAKFEAPAREKSSTKKLEADLAALGDLDSDVFDPQKNTGGKGPVLSDEELKSLDANREGTVLEKQAQYG